MRDYELTLVLPGEVTAAKKKSAKEQIEKMVETFKGKVAKYDDWGKIELPQPVKSQETGNFLFFNLQLEPASAKTLGDKLKLEEGILRYLLIRKE